MPTFIDIFLTFFRVGSLTFGGGYAVLPLLQKEAADRKNWITYAEVVDYYAVGQCLPGLIGVNTVILIGYKVNGKRGAIAAACGFVAPSILIILTVASLIQNIADMPAVQHAFAGIRVAVCALIIKATYTLAKAAIVNAVTACIAVIAFVAAAWMDVSPVPLVLLAAAAGIAISLMNGPLAAKPDAGDAGNSDAHANASANSGNAHANASASASAGNAGETAPSEAAPPNTPTAAGKPGEHDA